MLLPILEYSFSNLILVLVISLIHINLNHQSIHIMIIYTLIAEFIYLKS
jgi:hypothetical protein